MKFTRKIIAICVMHFLVGAFLEKRVDYSHDFSSVFLVGAILVKRTRLLQWLVFFSFFFVRLFTHRVCTTFCERFTFTKKPQYLILNASKCLYLEMQNPKGSPLPIFWRYETFPAPSFGCVRLFSKFFKSSKGPPFYFFGVLHLNGR